MSYLEKLKQLEPIQFRYKKEYDPDQKVKSWFFCTTSTKGYTRGCCRRRWNFNVRYVCFKRIYDKAKEELKAKNS